MKDSLVDAQATARQRTLIANFEQTPTPQRPHGRQCAPVWPGKPGQGEIERCERRMRGLAVERAGSSQWRIHFNAGAQQQNVALEVAELEGGGNHVDGCRWLHGSTRGCCR